MGGDDGRSELKASEIRPSYRAYDNYILGHPYTTAQHKVEI